MSPRIEIQGKRFGKLVAVEKLPKDRGMRRWRLQCDCGGERILLQKGFASGGSARCCGCSVQHFTKHGLSHIPEYRHWVNMIIRCEYEGATGYASYGGRGIKVCPRWRVNFKNYYDDLGPRPAPGYSVDRIDVNGDYEPSNCRWASHREQARNTRVNHHVTLSGARVTLAEAAEKATVPYNTVLYRLKRGWNVDDAVALPARKGFRP